MNRKRLIITSVISIVLISVLMISTTYSIFTSTEVDENANVYKTGNLDITYTLSEENVTLDTNTPTSNEDSIKIKPYRITVTNNGTVPYMFDLILEDTTASDVISYEYIMVQVGKLEPVSLSSCTENIIREDIIVPANDSATIDVRIWASDTIQNTEIGKSFYAKLSIDGLAIYDDSTDIDNSILIAERGQNFAEYIVSLYDAGASDIRQVATGEYRYYGANPANGIQLSDYESFKFDIIGVSTINGELRVKVIERYADQYNERYVCINDNTGQFDNEMASYKAALTSMGNNSTYSYLLDFIDSTYSDWSSALYDTGLIGRADYHLSGYSNGEYLTADGWYEKENSNYNSWNGYTGIMYMSDYLYAGSDSCLDVEVQNYAGTCASDNWLTRNSAQVANNYQEYILALMGNDGEDGSTYFYKSTFAADGTYSDFYISDYSGSDVADSGCSLSFRRVFYLNADVVVTGGDGSSTYYTIS